MPLGEIFGLKEEQGIKSKKDHLKKFKKQIEKMASLIDTWWLWVHEYFEGEEIDEECRNGRIQKKGALILIRVFDSITPILYFFLYFSVRIS